MSSEESKQLDLEPPMATINRLMKASLSEGGSVSKEAKQMVSRSSSLFVLYVTNRASEIAQERKRQTINADDVQEALRNLNFDAFLGDVERAVEAFREEEERKKSEKQAKKKQQEDGKEEEEEDEDDEEDD